jgi:hypothetical protein
MLLGERRKIMVTSYEETSKFKAVTAKELMLVNGGKGSSSQISWGNPVDDYVIHQIEATYYKINNAVGYTVLNTAPIIANTIIGFGTTFISGISGVVATFMTNSGGSSGSLY